MTAVLLVPVRQSISTQLMQEFKSVVSLVLLLESKCTKKNGYYEPSSKNPVLNSTFVSALSI